MQCLRFRQIMKCFLILDEVNMYSTVVKLESMKSWFFFRFLTIAHCHISHIFTSCHISLGDAYHIRPVVDEDLRGFVSAQLQSFLHQRDVLYSPAWFDTKWGCNHQFGLKNTEIVYKLDCVKMSNGQAYSIMTFHKKQQPELPPSNISFAAFLTGYEGSVVYSSTPVSSVKCNIDCHINYLCKHAFNTISCDFMNFKA